MNDDEWEAQRSRAIMAAFQTGRPVLADSEGRFQFADGEREQLGDDVGVAQRPLPTATAKVSWWQRLWKRGPR